MAPLRRKKGTSPTTSASPARNSPIPQLSPSRLVVVKTPMKSPLRQVRHAGITKNQKAVILENLNLEITERAKKLRAQYTMQARALKQRIEMRINRVPKKLWDVTMGELLAQHGPIVVAENMTGPMSTKLNAVAVKGFVEDVKRLSGGEQKENPQSTRLVVQKKRITKKTTTLVSAREQMPPPPVPAAANTSRPLALSPSKSNLPPTSSPTHLESSPTRPTAKTTTKTTVKIAATKAPARAIRKIIPSNPSSVVSSSSRPSSRATTRSSIDTSVTSSGSGQEAGKRAAKASQTKAKAATAAAATTANSGLKRGGVKGTGSNGSLKENHVEGVRKEGAPAARSTKKDITTTSSGGRVLRSRK